MFGYVLPRRDKLNQEAQDRYRAAYCGLCRCLQKRYGFGARFFVNYDMTFLYFLLARGEAKPAGACFCPARCIKKKQCLPADDAMEYAADLTVLLSYWKIRDTKRDSGFWKRMGAQALLGFYRRAYRKAADRRPTADKLFAEQLERLEVLEQGRCASIDRSADAFAALLRNCTEPLQDEKERRITQLLLYHVGRYLYLVDALEDLPKDVASDHYNPLRYRYCVENGALCAEDKAALLETIEGSISMAASALELLPSTPNREILENMIYYGFPAVLYSVAEGSFRKRGKRHEGPL